MEIFDQRELFNICVWSQIVESGLTWCTFQTQRQNKKLWLEKFCYIFSIKISLENPLYIVTWYDCWFILLNRLSYHDFKKQIFCPQKNLLNPKKPIFSNYNRAFFLIYNNFFYTHPAFFLSSVVFFFYLDNILLMNF